MSHRYKEYQCSAISDAKLTVDVTVNSQLIQSQIAPSEQLKPYSHAQINLHIFDAEKGDYYQITDGAKQNAY
jgi:hypothetical protein